MQMIAGGKGTSAARKFTTALAVSRLDEDEVRMR